MPKRYSGPGDQARYCKGEKGTRHGRLAVEQNASRVEDRESVNAKLNTPDAGQDVSMMCNRID